MSEIHDLTIEQASAAMAHGKLSSVQLTEHLLARNQLLMTGLCQGLIKD